MTPFFGKTSYKTTAINFLLNSVYGKVLPISNKTLLNLIPFNTGMESALFYTRCNCLNVDDKGKLMINTNISNINQSVLQASSSQSVKNPPYSSSSARPNESPSSIVTISPQAKLANIGSKYDVTNISPNEVKSMATELYENNLISEKDSLLMYVPLSIDENPDQKSNYLDAMKKDLKTAIETGYIPQKDGISEKRINILEQLESLFSG